ncbi:hypothetical protein [Aquipuribacter nitratireducens]|uniref:Phosphodiester glycosidase domain-containing protein n=1 Tax=Aquipuribacter nitratireducens TaxID=650104 RepID=A0ABW0GIK8_9MICO
MPTREARHHTVTGLLASRGATLLLLLAVVLVAVLAVRDGTARERTDSAATDAGRVDLAPVAALPVWPAPLGTPVAGLPDGLAVGPVDARGCRALLRDADGGLGAPVGWVVADRVAAVSLHRRGGSGEAVPLAGVLPAEALAALDTATAHASRDVVPVHRHDLRLLVTRDEVRDGRLTLVTSDLGAGHGPAWAELRRPSAGRCALDPATGRTIGTADDVPLADPGGWKDLRVDEPVPAAVARDLGEPEVRGSCTLLRPRPDGRYATGASVVLVADGVVRAVGLRAGGLAGVISVGDRPERLRATLPDAVGAAELRAMRDNGGVSVRLGPGRGVVVGVDRPTAVVPGVDSPAPGPELLVSSVLVGRECGSAA